MMNTKHEKIFFLLITIFSSIMVTGQVNNGFESRLDGWIFTGTKENISLDSVNQQSGKYCVRIKSNSGIAQRVAIEPLTILQFDFFVKTSDEKSGAYSYIKF